MSLGGSGVSIGGVGILRESDPTSSPIVGPVTNPRDTLRFGDEVHPGPHPLTTR